MDWRRHDLNSVTQDLETPHKRPSIRVKLVGGCVDVGQHKTKEGREREPYSQLCEHVFIKEKEMIAGYVTIFLVEPGTIIFFVGQKWETKSAIKPIKI